MVDRMYKPVVNTGITFIGDMDSVVYNCGFSGQTTIYSYDGVDYTSKRDLKIAHPEGSDVFESKLYDTLIESDPISFVIPDVRKYVLAMLNDVGAENYIFYLTGKNNFRDKVATIAPYKGHRQADRPIHYEAIRQYLINKWGAIVVEGMEADDACIMKAVELDKIGKDYVVATRDKDLFQHPCKFYRY